MNHPEAPDNLKVVKSFYEAFDNDDMSSALRLLDEAVDWKFQGPTEIPCTGAFLGIAGVKRFLDIISEHVEIEEFNIRQHLTDGPFVISLGDERVRVKSTGQHFEMEWVDVFTLQNGKIIRFREYADTAAMLLAYRGETGK